MNCLIATVFGAGPSVPTSSDRRSVTPSTSATATSSLRRSGETATARAFSDEQPSASRTLHGRRPSSASPSSPASPDHRSGTCLYSFPPNDFAALNRGYEQFAERFSPIIDVFEREGVRFALEVHPTEIAYDFVTTRKALDAIGHRPAFGLNLDPSHFAHQFLDAAAFAEEFADRIYHVHVKDSRRRLDGRRSILGSHLDFGDADRGWDFVSPGHGDVDFEALIRSLNRIGYRGPLSIEWEDSGMDREWGAQNALAFTRRADFPPSHTAFDSAFGRPDAEKNGRPRNGTRSWPHALGARRLLQPKLGRTRTCASTNASAPHGQVCVPRDSQNWPTCN